MTEAKTYTCENCGGSFEYEEGWSDEDAKEEADRLFGRIDPTDAATICDDCFQKLGLSTGNQ